MGRTMLHYLGPKVGRIPLSTLDEVRLAATGGLLAETQWVELKEMPSPSSRPTNVELAKDLEFEAAAQVRDEIQALRERLLQV